MLSSSSFLASRSLLTHRHCLAPCPVFSLCRSPMLSMQLSLLQCFSPSALASLAPRTLNSIFSTQEVSGLCLSSPLCTVAWKVLSCCRTPLVYFLCQGSLAFAALGPVVMKTVVSSVCLFFLSSFPFFFWFRCKGIFLLLCL